jgi:hypothetical protein
MAAASSQRFIDAASALAPQIQAMPWLAST